MILSSAARLIGCLAAHQERTAARQSPRRLFCLSAQVVRGWGRETPTPGNRLHFDVTISTWEWPRKVTDDSRTGIGTQVIELRLPQEKMKGRVHES
jgi:hypothetical protein